MSAQSTPSVEEARRFVDSTSFHWHQRFELVPGVETPGPHDIGFLFEAAGIPADLSGRSVLDIGTSNGGAAFVMERAGAGPVVALDIYPEEWFGFGALRSFLGSGVEYVRGTVYELDRLVGGRTFDLVLFWGVLYHLRHPLLALDQVRSVLSPEGEVSIETAISDDEVANARDLACARFYRRGELGDDPSNWFSPTARCLEDWCISSGLQPTATHVWGEGQGKRCMASCRCSEVEYPELSYERPLRVEADGVGRIGLDR